MGKKINHLWSILCTGSSVDKTSNNISLFNLTERLNMTISKEDIAKVGQKMIVAPIYLEIVNQFEVLSRINKFDLRFDFTDPSGHSLMQTEQKVELLNEVSSGNIRFILKVDKIKITTAGKYSIKIYLKELGEKEFREIYAIPLQIDFILK